LDRRCTGKVSIPVLGEAACAEGRLSDPWRCPWAILVVGDAGGTCWLAAVAGQRESLGTQDLVHLWDQAACGVPTWQRAQCQDGWVAWKGPEGLMVVKS